MRRFQLLLSAATLPLALAATPVLAQDGGADSSIEDDVQQQADDAEDTRAPTAPDPAAATNSAGSDVIIVSGIRASLETAQAIKRDSDSILDAIVAEDIGKLPDNTAAESIARIAGVQVNRYADEASGVLIRGLPDVATSYNGREIFTAELRRVQLQDFPSQALAGIEVYKSGTADIIEPGLAGLVNVRTRRPFDFKDQVIAGGFHVTYNDQSRKYDPSGNVLFSDRWDVGDGGEFGILANVTYAQSQYYNGVRYNATWIRDNRWSDVGERGNINNDTLAGGTGSAEGLFWFPNNIGLYNDGGKRYRPSGNFAMQFKPDNDLEFYVEGIYQGYRGRGYADNFDVPLEAWGPDSNRPLFTDVELLDGMSYDDTVLLPGQDPPYDPTTVPQAASLRKQFGAEPQAYRSSTKGATDTYQIAGGAIKTGDWYTLSTDAAYSWSRYTNYAWSIDSIMRGATTVDVDFNRDGGVAFNFPDWDATDPANYYWRGYYESAYDVKGSGFQWRGDFEFDTGLDTVPSMKVGLRYTDRTSQQVASGNRYGYTVPLEVPFADIPGGSDLELTTNPFRSDVQGFTQYLAIPRDTVFQNTEELRQYTYEALGRLVAMFPDDQGYRDAYEAFSTEDIQIDPSSAWKAKEKTYAGYWQAKFDTDLAGLEVSGVAGVRFVYTDGSTSGTSVVCTRNNPGDLADNSCTEQRVPRTEYQNYLDVLPNFGVRIKFTPELQLRLGYTETRTKPEFRDLNPSLNIRPATYTPCSTDDPSDVTSCRRPGQFYPDYVGSQGNPQLLPFTSNNWDASLEYYFSRTGFLSAAVFYRDLYGFLTGVTRRRPNDPQYGNLELNSLVNGGDGKIKGAEINAQTFLDFLPAPWNGFGVSGNITYLKGESRYPNGYNPETDSFEGDGEYLKIPGLSKWTYNLAVFYEKGPITARASFNKRAAWVNGYSLDAETGNQYTGNGTRARERLDASISYDITENFTLSADVANILAKPFRNYIGYLPGRTYPIDVRDEGRYYGATLRFQFGE